MMAIKHIMDATDGLEPASLHKYYKDMKSDTID